MQRNNMIVLWPAYFDSAKTRSQGRRVPRKLAVSSPSIDTITNIVKELGLKHQTKSIASFPRLSRKNTGSIMIEKSKSKSMYIKDIAKKLKETSK